MPPPPIIPTSALSLGVEALACVRAACEAGMADARATFELSLAAPSADVGFFVAAGLELLLDALERFRVKSDELQWLESVGVIDAATRKRLEGARFGCDIDAAPEGTVVFPGECLLVVEGPFWQAQLVEGLARSAIAPSTLTATKFARAVLAAAGADLVESGASSMHRLGGAPTLARAAFIGGACATTSALAAKRYGLPVRAAEPAHLAAAIGDRATAMSAWLARAPRGSSLLAVDGREAISAAVAALHDHARETSWEEARSALIVPAVDAPEVANAALAAFAVAKLPEPTIFAGGPLDERTIVELVRAEAPFAGYYLSADPGLDSVSLARFELVAIEEKGEWAPRIRFGPSPAESSDPARKIFARYTGVEGAPVADIAHLAGERLLRAKDGRFVDRASDYTARLHGATAGAPLLSNVMRQGKRVAAPESARAIRERASKNVAALADRHKRLVRPARYTLGMTAQLAALKAEMLGGST
jgi:nicotinate phosphoribosyltransferase